MNGDKQQHDRNPRPDVREKIRNWREEREHRLLGHIYKRNPSCAGLELLNQPVSAAVLGIKKNHDAPKSADSYGRLPQNMKTSGGGAYNKQDSQIQKFDQFKSRHSHGNFNQRYNTMGNSNFNPRYNMMGNGNFNQRYNMMGNNNFNQRYSSAGNSNFNQRYSSAGNSNFNQRYSSAGNSNFKHRYNAMNSMGNGHYNQRNSMAKVNNHGNSQNKIVKNEDRRKSVFISEEPKENDNKGTAPLEKCEANANSEATNNCDEKKSPSSATSNDIVTEDNVPDTHNSADLDQQNSTFTFTNNCEDENLPSPIEKGFEINKPVDNIHVPSILKETKHPSEPAAKTSSRPEEMRKKLDEWASSQGKPGNSYRHLNCFISNVAPKTVCKTPVATTRKVQFKLSGGKFLFTPKKTEHQGTTNKQLTANNSENENRATITEVIQEIDETGHEEQESVAGNGIASSTPEPSIAQGSLQPLCVAQPPQTKEVLKSMTISALEELLSLIQSNYSLEACEEWVLAIRQRDIEADELPIYWECIAAIEEKKGNVYLALDSYQRAVEQGAEVQQIDSCLDRMFEKLKALDINAKEEKENVPESNKAVINSANNKDVFKSTMIAFARLQKKVKQCDTEAGGDSKTVKYLVTPVRRSTRYSSSRVDTPLNVSKNVKELLQDDKNMENNVEFKTNKALLHYF